MVTSSFGECVSALHRAVEEGSKQKVADLLSDQDPLICGQILYGFTAMHQAVRLPGILKLLLELGGPVDAAAGRGLDLPCPAGATALHLAAYTGNSDSVQLLLDSGADGNRHDSLGRAPLHYASMEGRLKVVEILVKAQVNINIQNSLGRSSLQEAITFNQYTAANQLLNAGASVHALDNQNRTALHLAAQVGAAGCITRLINLGAAVDARTKKGNTPLMVCVCYSQLEAAKVLLENQADSTQVNEEGMTLLHLASEKGKSIEMLEWVISVTKPINMNKFDRNGRAALHVMSAKASAIDSLQLLIDYGMAINMPDKNGRTPLHTAAHEGNCLSVAVLLQLGGDTELCDDKGCFPIDYARVTGMREVFRKYGRRRKLMGELAEVDEEDMKTFNSSRQRRSSTTSTANAIKPSNRPTMTPTSKAAHGNKRQVEGLFVQSPGSSPRSSGEHPQTPRAIAQVVSPESFKNTSSGEDNSSTLSVSDSEENEEQGEKTRMELSKMQAEVSFILQEGETALRQSVEEEVKGLQRDLHELYQNANSAVNE